MFRFRFCSRFHGRFALRPNELRVRPGGPVTRVLSDVKKIFVFDGVSKRRTYIETPGNVTLRFGKYTRDINYLFPGGRNDDRRSSTTRARLVDIYRVRCSARRVRFAPVGRSPRRSDRSKSDGQTPKANAADPKEE